MFNWRFASDYLKHYFTAKSRHGVHSPFVYELIDNVIYDFSAKTEYLSIEQIRQQLLQSKAKVKVVDLGAGSHINKDVVKEVRTIAKNALKPQRLAQLIFRLVAHLQPPNLIELGTCLGITSLYLHQANPSAQLTTIEGCQEIAAVAAKNFEILDAKNISLLVGNFDSVLPEVLEKVQQTAFVFIDGNHTEEATLRYFDWILPKAYDKTVIVFDDIYWSEGMKAAWKKIKQHPQVTVTVDLFWIGLVFFKKDQVKEDFKVKF
ncbi:O-methyltransferase [Mucilaginibacter arboris]|uniref:SAM-dependent methyltransferase n=1 Tax=Mucilaginibacter arboris TaxID=2682090 RepID=A0A7K1SV88_9SPHI|nr:class I SAM-dependent methyltransferase [Mucilaginibacter arboris]MVN21157.1 SAM-dependent methyltransferase [Mucilaginibacter arboris]